MSKKGKMPIRLPPSVSIEQIENVVRIRGPRGEMEREVHDGIVVSSSDGIAKVVQNSISKKSKALYGLERSLINNMVVGVSEGFSKTLTLVGTGYKVFHKDTYLDLKLMKSHEVHFQIPKNIEIKVNGTNTIHVIGNDKQQVGQVSANISAQRKKDPYKGKGIHIKGEYIIRKAGKTKKK